jgi:hypothetical protein
MDMMIRGNFRHHSETTKGAKPWLIGFAVLAGCLSLASGALAQQTALNSQALIYREYPQPTSQVQPLQFKNFPKWATLDMYIRERGESQSSEKYVSGYDAIYDLSRIWGGLEVRPTKWLTAYMQFTDAHALGLPLYYVSANQRDAFDLRQAFLEYHDHSITIIAGRQELRYGNERILGISNWTNTSRTWDGFLGRIGDKNRLDIFSTSPVVVRATSPDTHGAGLTFHGAVGTITTWVPHMVFMPFVYVKALPRVKSQQNIYGTETEVTPGMETSAKFKYGFYFDLMGAMQRGSYANDSIRAAAGHVKTGYWGDQIHWKPRLAGEYDYASGNPNPTTSSTRIGTFDFLYPGNHNAFGLVDLFGFENIKEERINLDMTPTKHLATSIQQEWMQVATVYDNVYSGSASATVKPPTGGFRSDDIGKEFDVSGQYAFLRNNLTLNVGVGHYFPGTLMQKASSAVAGKEFGSPLTLAYFGLTYKFKVERKQ